MTHRVLKTSAGQIVNHGHRTWDYSEAEKLEYQQEYLNDYPGIEPIYYTHLNLVRKELLPTRYYNCWAFTFDPRQCWISTGGDVQKILDDNGTEVPDGSVKPGDIICYRRNNSIMHTGRVWEVDSAGHATVIRSKWGGLGEYLHPPLTVPPNYGTEITYWRCTPLQGRARLFLKDSSADDGSQCSPEPYWDSPDIWVDSNLDGNADEYPIINQANHVYAQVRNEGTESITNVQIRFYWGDPTGDIPASDWNLIGTFTILNLAGNSTVVAGPVTWVPLGGSTQQCLFVIAVGGDDILDSSEPDPIVYPFNVRWENCIGMRNVTVISATYDEQEPPGVILLFDTSGSMSWSHEGQYNVVPDRQRLTLAKRAAIPFLHLLYDYYPGQAKFGIVTFPWHPWQSGTSCNGQIVTSITQADDVSVNIAVSQIIPNLIAEGNTPLIAGVYTSITALGIEPRRAIVLLSDGYHNCPSQVNLGDPQVTDLINSLVTGTTRVYSIGFGRPTDIDHPLLQALADQTNGYFHDVTGPNFDPLSWDPSIALQDTYKKVLVECLELQPVVDPLGTINEGQTITREVKLNKHDQKISFYLSWVTTLESRLDLTIYSSDSQIVPIDDPEISYHYGDTFLIITLNPGFLQKSGKLGSSPWKVEIIGKGLEKGEQEKYHFSVISKSGVKLNPILQALPLSTGTNIIVKAEILEKGKPIIDLKNVFVKVSRPEESIGNWLSKYRVDAEKLNEVPRKYKQETLPLWYRKARYLVDIQKEDFPLRTDVDTIQLFDDGTHGDETADDGIYTNVFTNTLIEGTYTFHFYATGHTHDGYPFEREYEIQKYIKAGFCPETSDVQVDIVKSDEVIQIVRVTVTPKDIIGNYLGSGYVGKLSLTVSWGKVVSKLQDNNDGTYSQMFELPNSISTKAEIAVKFGRKTKLISLSEGAITPNN